MNSKRIKSHLGDIPNPFNLHESFFSDVTEAKFAIRGVLRAYFGQSKDASEDYLFFKSTVVRFDQNPEVDLELDHRGRRLIFVIKEPSGEGADQIKNRIRNNVALEFAALASESRGRIAMSIYRALDAEGKKAVVEGERKNFQDSQPLQTRVKLAADLQKLNEDLHLCLAKALAEKKWELSHFSKLVQLSEAELLEVMESPLLVPIYRLHLVAASLNVFNEVNEFMNQGIYQIKTGGPADDSKD